MDDLPKEERTTASAERDPITRFWGRSTQPGPRATPGVAQGHIPWDLSIPPFSYKRGTESYGFKW